MAKKLQVFVSSTYTDLKQERQAAVAAILKSGHIPAGMELFTSGDQSQWDTIKSWIDESDVYMLILGGRYGSVDPVSKLAYTELEYDYAVAKGKPFFAVVIKQEALDRKVKAEGISVVEMENGGSLAKFRSKVLSSISSFFDDEKDIRLTVYESLADFAANKDLIGWVPGNTVVNTVPLFDEIKKLSEENIALRGKVAELERRSKKGGGNDEEINDLLKVLKSIKVEVPKTVGKKEPFDLDILSIFLQMQDSFSSGIYNNSTMHDLDNFLFFTVAPKLQIHGLVNYEKVAGVQYRRCSLTMKGANFLSEIAKRRALNAGAKSAPTPVAEEIEVKDGAMPSSEPVVKKAKSRAKKAP